MWRWQTDSECEYLWVWHASFLVKIIKFALPRAIFVKFQKLHEGWYWNQKILTVSTVLFRFDLYALQIFFWHNQYSYVPSLCLNRLYNQFSHYSVSDIIEPRTLTELSSTLIRYDNPTSVMFIVSFCSLFLPLPWWTCSFSTQWPVPSLPTSLS